jgi:hypothetical protein
MPSFFSKRKGTSSKYQSAPAPPPKDKRNVPRSLPSYKDQDQETSTKDADKEKKDNEDQDKKVNQAAGKSNEGDEDKKVTKPSGSKKVENDIPKNREYINAPTKVGNIYNRLWSNVTDYTLHPRNVKTNAYFIPNAIPLFRMLAIALPLVARTKYILKEEVGFNPYAVATGYAYLYYIQILRAKSSATDLQGRDASALSRFLKYNKLEEIPIPDFLIPFYESIVATQMADTKYAWIVPNWTTTGVDWPRYAAANNHMTVNSIDYLRPNVAYMLMMLATYGCQTTATYFNHFDADRVFTPVSFDNGATPPVRHAALRFMNAGHNMTNGANHNVTDFLTTLGPNFPFQFWNDNHRDALTDIRESNFFCENGINTVLSTTDGAAPGAGNIYTNPFLDAATNQTVVMNNIDEYLFVAKENNPLWFQYIRDQMQIFCKFFPDGQVTMDHIATTGGLEATIIGKLKTETRTAGPPVTYLAPDMHFGKNDSNIEFNPKVLRSLTASLATARSDIEREHTYQAMTIGINSNSPVTPQAAEIFRSGRLFEHDLTQVQTIRGYLGEWEDSRPGELPMYSDFKDLVRDSFNAHPN